MPWRHRDQQAHAVACLNSLQLLAQPLVVPCRRLFRAEILGEGCHALGRILEQQGHVGVVRVLQQAFDGVVLSCHVVRLRQPGEDVGLVHRQLLAALQCGLKRVLKLTETSEAGTMTQLVLKRQHWTCPWTGAWSAP